MTYQVLFVCTGNICRSPLAAAMTRAQLAQRGRDDVTVSSAGTGAWEGQPASEGAYLIGLERELDLSDHRAQLLTRDLLTGVDLVFTMARHHRQRVEDLGGETKVHVLGEYAGYDGPEAEVADPFGGDLDVYRDTYRELERFVGEAVKRLEGELARED